MPARDAIHEAVVNALIKDGWTITHDPLVLEFGEERLFVDLGAERLLAAEKGVRKIAVEIKAFTGLSRMTDLGRAIGQYVLYRMFLRRIEPDRELYLAVPQSIVREIFQAPVGEGFLTEEDGRVIGFDIQNEELIEWLP